ncbi:TetR family transcriptional regulator C-terminal domain-containing protein [Nisaea sp.]|uniref:TetR family transcriptional regulator C-terminal domain-containing protein n=1 Tax=Nisaea sp. TaxID=2024842 RepID=UPI00329A5253
MTQVARKALMRAGLVYLTERGYSSVGGAKSCGHPARPRAAFFWIGLEGAVLRAKFERKAEPFR